MAKLSFGEGLHLEVPTSEESSVEVKEVSQEVIKEQTDVLLKLRLAEIEEKFSKDKETADKRIKELEKKLSEVERPIVKEIKIDKTNRDDFDALERDILKTVKKLSSERKAENVSMAKMLLSQSKFQGAVNFVFIAIFIMIIFLK